MLKNPQFFKTWPFYSSTWRICFGSGSYFSFIFRNRIQIFWNLYNTFYLRKNIKCILKNDLLKGYTLCLKLNRQGSYAASDPRKILSDPDPAKRFPLGRTGCRTFILHNNSFSLPQTERYQIRELFLREYTVHNTQYTIHSTQYTVHI